MSEEQATYEVEKRPDVGQDLMVFDGMCLALHQNLTLPQAGAILEKLYQSMDWSQFYIGDLLNHCNEKFGEDFAQIVDPDKYRPKTLQRFAYIADRIPPDNRRQELSYSMHVEVAHLDPDSQIGWLQMAIDEEWTVNDFREALGKKKPPKDKKPKAITCHHCDRWRFEDIPCTGCTLDMAFQEHRQTLEDIKYGEQAPPPPEWVIEIIDKALEV